MSDLAFSLLSQHITRCTGDNSRLLWVIDENISALELAVVASVPNSHVLTNRCDLANSLQAKGCQVVLSDFDFSSFANSSFDRIFYRISKEKAIVHHVINCSAQYLKGNGQLLIAGYKNEGIKTYVDKARQLFVGSVSRERGGQSSLLAIFECPQDKQSLAAYALDDKHYAELRVINPDDSIALLSKPGIFGWNKIDQGSFFLVEHLKDFFQQLPENPVRIADLGCGYGYLSVMASQFVDAVFIATDNNVAAVAACQQNFQRRGLRGDVVVADCAEGIDQSVDVVLCNPPFHQGFAVDDGLTEKFLLSCKRLLKTGGHALFVVNSFIALERKAQGMFSRVCTINNNKRFKLIALKK